MSKSTEVATTQPHKGLLEIFGERYNVPANRVRETLQKTAFPDAKDDSDFIAMLVVANTYKLNPFLKQIYAFSKNGKVTPVISVDGWIKIINEQPALLAVEFEYAEKKIVIGQSKPCHEWVECSITRSDRDVPITVREYFDECYMSTPPWNGSPKRMLRHRALIQAGRLAFGIAATDPDAAQRIQAGEDEFAAEDETPKPTKMADKARRAMKATPTPPEPQEAVSGPPVAAEAPPEEVEDADWEEAVVEEAEVVGDEPSPALSDAVARAKEALDASEIPEDAVSPRQRGALSAARSRRGWSKPAYSRLLAKYDITDIKYLPASRYEEVMGVLQQGEPVAEQQEEML